MPEFMPEVLENARVCTVKMVTVKFSLAHNLSTGERQRIETKNQPAKSSRGTKGKCSHTIAFDRAGAVQLCREQSRIKHGVRGVQRRGGEGRVARGVQGIDPA